MILQLSFLVEDATVLLKAFREIMSDKSEERRDAVDKNLMLRVSYHDDVDAFEGICRYYFNHIYNYLFEITRGEGGGSSAEDLVQETYIVLWNLRKKYKPTARLKTFLFYIATIQHKKWVKSWLLRNSKFAQLEDNVEPSSHSQTRFENEEVEEIETIEKIILCIEALPEKYKEIFKKLYIYDSEANLLELTEESSKTLAEKLNISYDTFRKRKERGLKLLVESLRKIGIKFSFANSQYFKLINKTSRLKNQG